MLRRFSPSRSEISSLGTVIVEDVQQPEIWVPLTLRWRYRSGGCLEPQAFAAMNSRQRIPRSSRPTEEPQLDRGARGGWHLDLVCLLCSSACRRLFASRWSDPARPSSRPWACRRYHRVTYESSNRPGSSRGRPEDPSGFHGGFALEGLHQPNLFLAWKVSALHWGRWDALRQLCLAHEIFSMAAWSEAIHRLTLQVGVDDPAPDHRLEVTRAQELLKENAWATRQSSWHRGGKPRLGSTQQNEVSQT